MWFWDGRVGGCWDQRFLEFLQLFEILFPPPQCSLHSSHIWASFYTSSKASGIWCASAQSQSKRPTFITPSLPWRWLTISSKSGLWCVVTSHGLMSGQSMASTGQFMSAETKRTPLCKLSGQQIPPIHGPKRMNTESCSNSGTPECSMVRLLNVWRGQLIGMLFVHKHWDLWIMSLQSKRVSSGDGTLEGFTQKTHPDLLPCSLAQQNNSIWMPFKPR